MSRRRLPSGLDFLVFVARTGHADIIVAADIDLVVRIFLGVLVDLQILRGKIGIGRDDRVDLQLGRVERQRLLGLEDRLRLPGDAAIDAGHRIILAKIVEARAAFRAAALGAPFRFHHR